MSFQATRLGDGRGLCCVVQNHFAVYCMAEMETHLISARRSYRRWVRPAGSRLRLL